MHCNFVGERGTNFLHEPRTKLIGMNQASLESYFHFWASFIFEESSFRKMYEPGAFTVHGQIVLVHVVFRRLVHMDGSLILLETTD